MYYTLKDEILFHIKSKLLSCLMAHCQCLVWYAIFLDCRKHMWREKLRSEKSSKSIDTTEKNKIK